jgi:hypothetical protein
VGVVGRRKALSSQPLEPDVAPSSARTASAQPQALAPCLERCPDGGTAVTGTPNAPTGVITWTVKATDPDGKKPLTPMAI